MIYILPPHFHRHPSVTPANFNGTIHTVSGPIGIAKMIKQSLRYQFVNDDRNANMENFVLLHLLHIDAELFSGDRKPCHMLYIILHNFSLYAYYSTGFFPITFFCYGFIHCLRVRSLICFCQQRKIFVKMRWFYKYFTLCVFIPVCKYGIYWRFSIGFLII